MRKKLITLALILITLSSPLMGCAKKNNGFSEKDLIYFILTDRFNDGNKENNFDVDKNDPLKRHGGDLRGIIDKLDYIKDLGATAIWITPVMKNEKDGYHGYWIEDFYQVDPHLGTMDDMKELVSKSQEKGIKVILDYVVNHTGYKSPWLTDDKHKDWFNEKRNIVNWSNQEEVENGWLAGLPDLNLNKKEVKDYFLENALWWIEQTGIDGMRLDTVKHVPISFWTEFVSTIKKKYPDFYFLGEVWSDDINYIKKYSETGIDGMTNYSMFKGITRSFYKYGTTNHIKNAIKDDSKLIRPELNGIFIDNHDNKRFISRHFEYGDAYLKQALTFTMTYPAIPVIYYGTEIGMEGYDDPDNRHDMPWGEIELGSSNILDFYKKLVELRDTKAMKNGEFKLLESDNNSLAYIRDAKGDFVVVIINTKDSEKTLNLNIQGKTGKLKSVFSNETYEIKNGTLNIKLKPLDIVILKSN